MKIPHKMLGKDVIVCGRYAIYTSSLLQASAVAQRLSDLDYNPKSRGIPCMGKMVVKGKPYWWCRYGFLNDPDIYTKKTKKRKVVKK